MSLCFTSRTGKEENILVLTQCKNYGASTKSISSFLVDGRFENMWNYLVKF